jgi:ubiquinone/menaquinone biosynthesis C-methylase UbiE
MNSLRLLPGDALVKTSEVDHADWNYRPVLGWIQRLRFKHIVVMLAGERFQRLLEVGYGSGVFMPELQQYCDELYGIDPHQKQREIREVLVRNGVVAKLFSCSVTQMPFGNDYFDCIVAVSTLEFVDEIESACQEIKRVLRPDGFLAMVTPGHSPISDFGLKILTGESAKDDYANRRRTLIPTLLKHFWIERKAISPRIGGSLIPLYTSLKLRVKSSV